MIYGYCRVSSKGQLDNNSLEQQEKEILSKYDNCKIYKEQYTGTTTHRPIFENIISQLEEGDTLVVCKLDRLARNTVEGIDIVEKLFDRGISVHVLNVGLLENTTMGRFFLTTLLAVAEMERNTIIERTQNGKEIAKTKAGFKEGRPKSYTDKQLDHALSLLTVNGGDKSYKEVCEITGISVSTIQRENNKRKLEKL
ncbi:DNA-invertase hin [Clostridium puniceum]|uniref:DNA-invertase hin n=1 Tax=Clostridium puniceum TaxID=29367 RepID=A0A1S8TVP7_9CLOT|nr:recombinase family protein [Clostridium puniceum]OOM81642.1 DNA-invertase hin [Clostridium puniceum]